MESFSMDWFDTKKAYELYLAGHSINGIAKIMDCSQPTCKRKLEAAYPQVEFSRVTPKKRSKDYFAGYNAGWRARDRSLQSE
jgi:hypothetical protein